MQISSLEVLTIPALKKVVYHCSPSSSQTYGSQSCPPPQPPENPVTSADVLCCKKRVRKYWLQARMRWGPCKPGMQAPANRSLACMSGLMREAGSMEEEGKQP